MLTFRVSASRSKAPYFFAESIIEVWGQWGTSGSARRGMQLHQAVIFLFFSVFFLSWRRNSSRGKFKSGLAKWRRCEGLNTAPLPKYCLVGKRGEGTVSSSEVFNVLAEQVKGNLPVGIVYSYVLGLHSLDSLSWVSFLSCPSNRRAINEKWSTEENIGDTGFFSGTVGAVCPYFVNLHYCILSTQYYFMV